GGPVASLASGKDGNVWFMTADAKGNTLLSSISTAGTITPDPLGAGSHVSSVIAGPDGDIWFADTGKSEFGRIDATGKLTVFPDPAPYSYPYSNEILALDGAGNLSYLK